MGKYIEIVKLQLQDGMVHRFNFFTASFFLALPIVSHLCVWLAMYRAGITEEAMKGYTLPMIITYTLLGHFVDKFSNEVLVQLKVATDIKDGLLSKYLIKPLDSILSEFAIYCANNIVNFITIVWIYIVLIFCYRKTFVFDMNGIKILLSIIYFLNAVFLGFLLNHIIGTFTFWLKEASALYIFTQSTFLFLSGGYIPLDLLPEVVYQFLMFTPFPYLLYFPVSIYVKNYVASEMLIYMMIGFGWSIILFLLDRMLFKKGLEKYTASGF